MSACYRYLVLVFTAIILQAANIHAQPSLIENEDMFFVSGANDLGQVIGVMDGQGTAVWNTQTGSISLLLPIAGGRSAGASDINNSGTVVGTTSFPEPFVTRGTIWPGGSGAGTSLGARNLPMDETGGSSARAINNSGYVVGSSSFCFAGETNPCRGGYPAGGNPLGQLGKQLNIDSPAGRYAEAVNDNGVAVGSRAIFNGGAETELSFNPRAILSDGTVIGDKLGGGGVVRRLPNGTIEDIPCGSFAYDANDAGDILTAFVNSDGLRIWHNEKCFRVSSVLPDGIFGWKFPSHSPASGQPALNELGQIATSAQKPGVPVVSSRDYVGVFLTPQYPLGIRVTATETDTPGEYVFETVVTSGEPEGTVSWDFGDDTTATGAVTSNGRVTKKYTKPGKFTIKATVEDADGNKATSTFVVDVKTPTLVVGITVPNFDTTGEVPIGQDFQIVVDVAVLDDGVGEIRDIAFQGGTFTVSDGDVLDFTTASTSPFSLEPGKGNSYPLNVNAANFGEVMLSTLVIGEDELGEPKSAQTDRTISILNPDEITPDTTLEALVRRATNNGRVTVSLTNNTEQTTTGRARFVKPTTTTILRMQKQKIFSKWKKFEVGAGQTAKAKLKLKPKIAKRVRRGKRVKATLVIETDAEAGATSTTQIEATLRRKKKKK